MLPDDLVIKYKNFRRDLKLLPSLKIERYLNITPTSLIQICGFADASKTAYAAVIYLRVINNGKITIRLLVSKTKVAPIKQISLPRLELCAALLLAKLINKVKVTMNFQTTVTYAFTDSTIVLAWLQAIPRKWKTFIANRTSQILEIVPFSEWHHVKSAENAADPASRGLLTQHLINFDLWWNGPSFLQSESFNKIISSVSSCQTNIEKRILPIVLHSSIDENIQNSEVAETFFESIVKRFSSLQKLVSVVAACRRFVFNLKLAIKKDGLNENKTLHSVELQESMSTLIKMAQMKDFSTEILLLKKGKILRKESKIISLNPFIDDKGILRVGGRLQEAESGYNKKHPIILTKNQNFTILVVRDIHYRYFHANQQLMMNILKTKYWIIGCKNVVKKCIRDCVICTRYRMEGYNQQMGNLPSYRIQPSRPFSNTGTDFAGPFQIKTWQGRGAKQLKCYIAIFICMATKAIHIELVSDLTTDKFLASLHRFVSRRGACNNLYSDNGKNFVGAARKLSEFQNFLRENEKIIEKELAKNEICWHFIPAYSPNFGGIWESAVKSMKYHMKRSIGQTVLTFEEMTTLLCQIEACLNSRPLTVITMDVDDPEPLTPGHFLTQGPILLPPQEIIDEKMSLSNRWRLVQHIQHSFWKRWSVEYISTLQTRKKWFQQSTNVKVDDIVLVREENLPPCRWLMGRIVATQPGRDGLVRVATIKTKNGIIDRSVRKLTIFLPTEN